MAALADSACPLQDFVRTPDLRDAPVAKNLPKNRPVQIAGTESVGKSTSATIPGRNLLDYRPMQIAGTESVGISTCATLSVAQVAFPAGFPLSRSPRRTFRDKICRNIDLCKSPRRNLLEYRPVQRLQLHKSRFRQVFLLACSATTRAQHGSQFRLSRRVGHPAAMVSPSFFALAPSRHRKVVRRGSHRRAVARETGAITRAQ